MKRPPSDGGGGGGGENVISFPQLKELILIHIVSSFTSDAGMQFYLSAVREPVVCDLIRQRWQQKMLHPDRELVQAKRRFVGAEMTIHYVERRELVGGGVISQVKHSKQVALTVNSGVRSEFFDLAWGKFSLDVKKSNSHKTTQFMLY